GSSNQTDHVTFSHCDYYNSNVNPFFLDAILADYITVRNCFLDTDANFLRLQGDHNHIVGNIFHNWGTAESLKRIWLMPSKYSIISHNQFISCNIEVKLGSNYTNISNNIFRTRDGANQYDYAILLKADTVDLEDIIVSHNNIHNFGTGVLLTQLADAKSQDIIIANNRIDGCTIGIHIDTIKNEHTMIHGNQLFGNTTDLTDTGVETRKHDNISNAATRTWLAEA
ncbi:unnamed protein product, partial [marine sediment metagenome]